MTFGLNFLFCLNGKFQKDLIQILFSVAVNAYTCEAVSKGICITKMHTNHSTYFLIPC